MEGQDQLTRFDRRRHIRFWELEDGPSALSSSIPDAVLSLSTIIVTQWGVPSINLNLSRRYNRSYGQRIRLRLPAHILFTGI